MADRLRITVADRDPLPPVLGEPGPEASGAGLRIVDRLATAWGCERRPEDGEFVWFETKAARVSHPQRGRSARGQAWS